MSRELWAVEKCGHGRMDRLCEEILYTASTSLLCPGGSWEVLDFDAIWDRFYEATNRRYEPGLTYDELRKVVFGE